MAMEFDLIAPDTLVEENGDGDASGRQPPAPRARFSATMVITDQIEQESLDLSIWGSADGENWGTHPILKLPQRFYRGETRAVLELAHAPGSEVHPREVGAEPLGPRGSDADVPRWPALAGSSGHAATS